MLVAIALACIMLIAGCVQNNYGKYTRDIKRNYSNADELAAITAAENLDYSRILNVTRWKHSDGNTTDYTDWHYPYYIDTTVLNIINATYIAAQTSKASVNIGYTYHANIRAFSSLTVAMRADRNEWNSQLEFHDVKLNGVDHGSVFNDPTIHGENDFIGRNATQVLANGTVFVRITSNNTMEFKDVYFIDLYLNHGATYGPKAAHAYEMDQLIIMDKSLHPLLVMVFDGGARIS